MFGDFHPAGRSPFVTSTTHHIRQPHDPQHLGVVVILMGLALMGMLSFMQRTKAPSFTPRTGLAGAPLLGLGFGLG